jgi:general stress protein YciG
MTDSKTQHRGGAGDFAENRERAAEAGHKDPMGTVDCPG